MFANANRRKPLEKADQGWHGSVVVGISALFARVQYQNYRAEYV